jgi:hypothetical protein
MIELQYTAASRFFRQLCFRTDSGAFAARRCRQAALPWLCVWILIFFSCAGRSNSEEVETWEFSPYEVQVWIHFSPNINESQASKKWLLHEIEKRLHGSFQASWVVHLKLMPGQLATTVRHGMRPLTVADLSSNDFVLAVSTTHSQSRTLRTYQAVIEQLDQVFVSSDTQQAMLASAAQFELPTDSLTAALIQRFSIDEAGNSSIVEKLSSGEIAAALLPRDGLTDSQQIRLVPTAIPWQSETAIHENDKLFLLRIDHQEDNYRVEGLEVDCPTMLVGPVIEASSNRWSQLANQAARLIQDAFAPIARVESSDATSARLLHRAGGLLVDQDGSPHPARIQVGDVMQPVIRRDDRNGVPILLQPLNFTFAAITESDGIKMTCNVYTYSGGPGLRGRQNPRTQRFLLRVRPLQPKSELKIVVRGAPQRAQAGCAVFDKDHLSEQFRLLGRTDWRGSLTIELPEEQPSIIPAAEEGAVAGESPASISLNAPLMLLYVRSGDQVLARLPFVPGLNAIELAELPDDQLRLQSEAFLRGFQGEILELVGRRNLLAARVRLHVERGNLDRANATMEQLRGLRNFNEMNDQLGQLQRTILEQTNATVNRASQASIDRMFKITRDMLQKYLQDETVADTGRILREAMERVDRSELPLEEGA